MRPVDNLLVRFRLRRAPPTITRRQAQQVRPLRNPQLEWHCNDDGFVVATLTRRAGLRGKMISFFLAVPESRPVVLDEVGTFVWHLCDGEHSVEQIAAELSREYKLSHREVEVSLNEFMRLLAKRGMIAVAVPKEVVAEMDPEVVKSLGLTELEVLKEKPSAEEAEGGSDQE